MRIARHILLAGLIAVLEVIACPTCMGRITVDSKPFFSNEFYNVAAGSMDHLYQSLNQPKSSHQEAETTAKVATNSAQEPQHTADNRQGESK